MEPTSSDSRSDMAKAIDQLAMLIDKVKAIDAIVEKRWDLLEDAAIGLEAAAHLFQEPILEEQVEPLEGDVQSPNEHQAMTGAEFRERRQWAGLSRRRAAELLQVHVRTIYRWEIGESRISPLQAPSIRLALQSNREARTEGCDTTFHDLASQVEIRQAHSEPSVSTTMPAHLFRSEQVTKPAKIHADVSVSAPDIPDAPLSDDIKVEQIRCLTFNEVAKTLRVSARTMVRLIHSGEMAGWFRIRGRLRIREDRVTAWMQRSEAAEHEAEMAQVARVQSEIASLKEITTHQEEILEKLKVRRLLVGETEPEQDDRESEDSEDARVPLIAEVNQEPVVQIEPTEPAEQPVLLKREKVAELLNIGWYQLTDLCRHDGLPTIEVPISQYSTEWVVPKTQLQQWLLDPTPLSDAFLKHGRAPSKAEMRVWYWLKTMERTASPSAETLAVKETAELLEVDTAFVRRLIKKGLFSASKVGNDWRVHTDQLREWECKR